MNSLTYTLLTGSILVLGTGAYVWRLTSSRPLLISVIMSSAFLLIGAYATTNSQRPEFAFVLPFFATMICGGRAVAMVWRGRKEKELQLPGALMTGMCALCCFGALAAFHALR